MNAKTWMRSALIFIFFISLTALGYHIFFAESDARNAFSPGSAGGSYRKVAQLPLGYVEVKNYQRMGFTRGILRFSPDSSKLAVGTETGQVLVLSAAGETLWERPAGIAKITAMDFSADGGSLYVGETGAEGNLYCLDAATGKERWKCGLAGELGSDIKRKNYPGVIRILTDQTGRVFALAQRYDRSASGESLYYAKIFCLSPSGQPIWQYPCEAVMDAWVNWMSVDARGGRVVFGTANFDTGRQYRYNKNLYCLAGDTGLEAWSAIVDPVPPFNRTILRGSPNISSDGGYVAAMASDGRAFLFDDGGRELWRRTLSQPKKISGVFLNAVGRDAYMLGDYAIFATINTYNNANWQLPTPVEHPSSNSLFVFAADGRFVSKWRAGGSIEEIAFAGRTLAAAVGRNTKTKDPRIHGLYVLAMPDATVAERMATDGPCVAAAVSPDRRYVAGLEAPLQMDDGTVVGSYQLWLWEQAGR
ncbi:MAG TPA: PQQ-binding-like beta-propeller repeat protein [Selenomonadales bacterium]|nr:PQQ-binding-like beta-propeller repeat protein [Selenomonadales bacterium]